MDIDLFLALLLLGGTICGKILAWLYKDNIEKKVIFGDFLPFCLMIIFFVCIFCFW